MEEGDEIYSLANGGWEETQGDGSSGRATRQNLRGRCRKREKRRRRSREMMDGWMGGVE